MHPFSHSLRAALTRAALVPSLLVGAGAAVLSTAVATPLLLAAAPPPGEHRAYVVTISDRGAYPEPRATILATVETALSRWVAESEGVISRFPVVAVGTMRTADCQDAATMWDEGAALFPDVDFGRRSGNHLIVIGPPVPDCRRGVGTIGRDLGSGGLVFVRYDPTSSPQTLLHELGHNVGLRHDHALRCDPACTDVGYGNQYSFMGYTTPHDPAYVSASLGSYQRQRLGVDRRCEIRTARLAPGQVAERATYVLHPRGSSGDARGVRVVDPRDGTTFYLDFRNAAGGDARAYYATSTRFRVGVTVEKVVTDGEGREVSQLQSTSVGEDGVVYSRVAGESFVSGGVTVRVDELGPRGVADATATVSVTLTALDGRETAAVPLADPCGGEEVVTSVQATPTPSEDPTPSPTPSPTQSPTQSPTHPVTQSPSPSATPTATLVAQPTPKIPLPSLAVPTIALPQPAIPTIALPSLAVPTLGLPSLTPPPVLTTPASTAPTPPVPTPPVPTPSVPTPPVPTPPAPTPPAPTVPAPTQTPREPHPAPTAPTKAPDPQPYAASTEHDVSHHQVRPPDLGFLPGTGSPRLLLAEIAAAAFLLSFGLALVVASARLGAGVRARPAGPDR